MEFIHVEESVFHKKIISSSVCAFEFSNHSHPRMEVSVSSLKKKRKYISKKQKNELTP